MTKNRDQFLVTLSKTEARESMRGLYDLSSTRQRGFDYKDSSTRSLLISLGSKLKTGIKYPTEGNQVKLKLTPDENSMLDKVLREVQQPLGSSGKLTSRWDTFDLNERSW